jgi:hypothetical protein
MENNNMSGNDEDDIGVGFFEYYLLVTGVESNTKRSSYGFHLRMEVIIPRINFVTLQSRIV